VARGAACPRGGARGPLARGEPALVVSSQPC